MPHHNLTVYPKCTDKIRDGKMRLQICPNDKPYAVDDLLVLYEIENTDIESEADKPLLYTGRITFCQITDVHAGKEFGIQAGFVALSIDCTRSVSCIH